MTDTEKGDNNAVKPSDKFYMNIDYVGNCPVCKKHGHVMTRCAECLGKDNNGMVPISKKASAGLVVLGEKEMELYLISTGCSNKYAVWLSRQICSTFGVPENKVSKKISLIKNNSEGRQEKYAKGVGENPYIFLDKDVVLNEIFNNGDMFWKDGNDVRLIEETIVRICSKFVIPENKGALDKEETINFLSVVLQTAWIKYKNFFGEQPHGTQKQLLAMLEFCIEEICAKFSLPAQAQSIKNNTDNPLHVPQMAIPNQAQVRLDDLMLQRVAEAIGYMKKKAREFKNMNQDKFYNIFEDRADALQACLEEVKRMNT